MTHSNRLSNRLRLAFAFLLLGCAVVVAVVVWRAQAELMEVRLQMTRSAVEQGIAIAQRFHAQVGSGKLEDAQARAQAAAEIMKIRYDGTEYLWINDMTPRMVAHPIKPELNGNELSGNKDPSGKPLFIEMVAVVKTSGFGYVDYLWPRPGSQEPEPKRSFVKGFAPWGWVLGSGVYVDAVQSTSRREALIAFGAVALLAGFAGWVLWQTLADLRRRLGVANELLGAMAEGDLSRRVDVGTADEIGQMLTQAEVARTKLTALIQQITHSSESIDVASREIAAGNHDLSHRTEQTAANLQQAASSATELTAAVRASADSARRANDLAGGAAAKAEQGGAAMRTVMNTMEEISAASRRISDIIGAIDSIAFQTNILALNAAVEAARAGEQGRGFAVVAGEVRVLAGRSAEAAREIKGLIQQSVNCVETGSAQVALAGRTMDEVVRSAHEVATVIHEVTYAATEQASGISILQDSVQSLDQMTQQNAALVEQAAAAASSLQQQAESLTAAVGSFRVG